MPPPPQPPLFRLPADPARSTSPFSPPPANTSSNGLFSAASTPVPHKSATPATLFAGATPAFRPKRTLFSSDTPSSTTPRARKTTSASPLFSTRPGAAGRARGKYTSPPSDAEIYEDSLLEDSLLDDSRYDEASYDDEMDTTGHADESGFDTTYDSADSLSPRAGADTTIELKPGTVTEPGALIIHTEEVLSTLAATLNTCVSGDETPPPEPTPAEREAALTRAASSFLAALTANLPKSPAGAPLHKAHQLASLLLPLHHSRQSVPETLRKYLTTFSPTPTPEELHTLKSFHPNAAAAPSFWPTLTSLLLRGEVAEALDLLNLADWTAGSWSSAEVPAVKDAVSVLVRLLESCPGLARSGYTSTGMFPAVARDHGSVGEWRIWQGSVYAACDALRGVGHEEEEESDEDAGYTRGGFGMAGRRREAVPAVVARGLRGVYEVMRGERDAVVAATGRWEDAVCAVMFWGVVAEEEEDEEEGREAVVGFDRARRERELLRLRRVTEALVEEMPLDPTSEVELAVGGVLTWDTSVVGDILAGFSLLVAAAVVEICGWAGSIDRGGEVRGVEGFDDEERAVLEMGGLGEEAEMAERVCVLYACGVCAVEWVDKSAEFEGWEAGVGVLGRVRGGREIAGKLLTQLELTSKSRVEKLLTYCNENNLTDEASDIAASFADHLTTTTSHGDALHFYSLSPTHRPSLHSLLTTLTTHSLLHSSPYPPTPDPTLHHLLTNPSSTPSALLRFELSGYATLRTFYTARDSTPPNTRLAASALVAVIKSAGERFDGGILDPCWDAAVEDWMLGALLGELLPLLGRGVLTVRQCCDVLKVVTDFEIVGGEVVRRAEEFMGRVLGREDVEGREAARGGGGGGGGGLWEGVRGRIDAGELRAGRGKGKWDWRVGWEGGVKEVCRVVRLGISREVARAWLEGEE